MATTKNNGKGNRADIKKQLKWVKPSEIKPYMNNPRFNDDAVIKVAESIAAFGFNSPIVVDEDMTILAGHTRWKAALKLELEKVPIFIISGLSEEQKKAYRIADNRTTEFSKWDWQRLEEEIKSIDNKELIDFLEFDFDESDSESQKVVEINPLFEVVVECESEEEQQEVFEKLTEMGLKCRLLTL